MKVKVNILTRDASSGLRSEAVRVPSLMMMTSMVSEESLAQKHGHVYVNFFNF